MGLSDLVTLKQILPCLRVESKKQCFRELARAAATALPLNEREVLTLLLEREMLGSTGTGYGVAIPHARVKGLEKPWGLFAKLDKPVDFESVDGEPVDLVFLLLAPSVTGSTHLKSLSKVSRLMRHDEVREELRAATKAGDMLAVLNSERSGTPPKSKSQPEVQGQDMRHAVQA